VRVANRRRKFISGIKDKFVVIGASAMFILARRGELPKSANGYPRRRLTRTIVWTFLDRSRPNFQRPGGSNFVSCAFR
jgi:hypothetical protein